MEHIGSLIEFVGSRTKPITRTDLEVVDDYSTNIVDQPTIDSLDIGWIIEPTNEATTVDDHPSYATKSVTLASLFIGEKIK